MNIRPCSAEDLTQLREHWPTPGTDIHGGHFAAHLSGQATYLVAWQEFTPLGSAMVQWGGCVGPNARAAFPNGIEINHLQVRAEHRGKGVGTALIAAAEDLAVSRGVAEVALGNSADNVDAGRLYRRLGYLPTGVLDVTSYVWIDADGSEHAATEEDELLVKALQRSRRIVADRRWGSGL